MCPDASTLSAYFDGELSDAHAAQIAEHIRSCPACRATLELFASQRTFLHSDGAELGEAPPLDGFWNYVGRTRVHKLRGPRRITLPLPLAAAAVVAFTVAVIFNFLPVGKNKIPDVVVVESRTQVPTVVSFTITPGDLDQFLAFLEGDDASDSEALHILPDELPLSRIGEPQMVRPAVLKGAP